MNLILDYDGEGMRILHNPANLLSVPASSLSPPLPAPPLRLSARTRSPTHIHTSGSSQATYLQLPAHSAQKGHPSDMPGQRLLLEDVLKQHPLQEACADWDPRHTPCARLNPDCPSHTRPSTLLTPPTCPPALTVYPARCLHDGLRRKAGPDVRAGPGMQSGTSVLPCGHKRSHRTPQRRRSL